MSEIFTIGQAVTRAKPYDPAVCMGAFDVWTLFKRKDDDGSYVLTDEPTRITGKVTVDQAFFYCPNIPKMTFVMPKDENFVVID